MELTCGYFVFLFVLCVWVEERAAVCVCCVDMNARADKIV